MNRPSEETLIRFFRGQCLADEETAVKIYLAMDIDKEFVEACLHLAFPDLDCEHDANITRPELDRVWGKLEARQHAYSMKTGLHRRWYAYAAAIAFVILSSVSLFIFKAKFEEMNSVEFAWKEVKARAGYTKTVKLEDSSTVILFPGSALRIANDFNKTKRQVKLTGRAFFRVRHNKKKPFFVSAHGLTTKVLGTSFELNRSTLDNENIITLHTGKISVNQTDKEIVQLIPNQQLRFNTKTGQFKLRNVHAAETIKWLNGELEYDQASLSTIVYDLERWYGIKVSTNNPELLSQKVTISFKDLPVAAVLNMLSKSADFDYTIQDKHITLKERGMEKN